jgi:hypothetical protein
MITQALAKQIVTEMMDWCHGDKNVEEDLYTLLHRMSSGSLKPSTLQDRKFLLGLLELRTEFKRQKQA